MELLAHRKEIAERAETCMLLGSDGPSVVEVI
jgi:hypothetical protein